VVGLLQAAQQPDGYLNSFITSVKPDERWADLRDGHELYCAGHLIEAGVAHFQATGRRMLLDVVCRYADYIARVFGTGAGQKRGYCGHPEIELALVRLYRATGEARYLALSKYFVDERGSEPYYFDLEAAGRTTPRASDSYYRRHGLRGAELRRYNQSHAPVREQQQVVGHAVRAMYLFTAMADVAAETGDESLRIACERLWSHLTSARLYVTGGLGSRERNEGFSTDYDLPNADAYAETCASIGLVLWAQRMLLLTGDGVYADVMERTLYNAIAGAVAADGAHFFYANPLASAGETHRQPWFQVACCPPNVARLLASLGQYVASEAEDHLAVHLFVRGSVDACVAGERVRLSQQCSYPWTGDVRLSVELERPTRFELRVRVPGWARAARLHVNGEAIEPAAVVERGYARLDRLWQSGDAVSLDLPMPIERIRAHPAVEENVGCVALQRGPIVYCVEQADNDLPLHTLMVPRAAPLEPLSTDGTVALRGQARAISDDGWTGRLYRTDDERSTRSWPLVAVPYAAWDNRAPGQMRVWLRESDDDG
jgi:DUF1680 family protein